MEKLTPEQIEKVKMYHEKSAQLDGRQPSMLEDMLPYLSGTLDLIDKLGDGDPVKAAEKRARMMK